MALKGQGDPRWIVESREDGTNVNHWHWTEQDWTQWMKDRLKQDLANVPLDSNLIEGSMTTVTTNGEVSVNTRKGKTIMFYELDVTIKWEASLLDTGKEGKGTIKLPYISEENEPEEFEIQVTMQDETGETRVIREEVRKVVIPILKTKIPKILYDLKDQATSKTKLQPKVEPAKKLENLAPIPATESPKPKQTSKGGVTQFTAVEKFMCSAPDLFATLTDINRVRAYAGGDAVVANKVGDAFKFFGGSVTGELVQMEPPTKMVQKWRFSSWPQGHYSTVTMELQEENGEVKLTLTQTNIPGLHTHTPHNGALCS